MSAILLGILTTVIADQLCATFPSLALKLARWSATCRYAGNPSKAELRAEELEALIEQRPGGLLKLSTALGLAIAALATASRRALGKNPVITIARATGRATLMGAGPRDQLPGAGERAAARPNRPISASRSAALRP